MDQNFLVACLTVEVMVGMGRWSVEVGSMGTFFYFNLSINFFCI